MSEFSKTFLKERTGDEARPREFFGIFGKHPGWNDHIEDLPLPTESMATAKQLLYVQGISSQVSSGAWARLAESARLPDFDHALLWVRGRQFLAGRMWASSDGKKRAHFPMVALVQGVNVDRDAALLPILSELEYVAAGCQAARTADQVRALVSEPWDDNRAASGAMPANARCTLDGVRTTAQKLATDFRSRRSPCTRLPADPADVCRSLRFWSRLATALAPAETPLLFLAPAGQPWVDLLIGEPAPGSFFCLRAGLPALPVSGADPGGAVEELDAEEFLPHSAGGQAPPGERSWISRLLRD